jgi:hypothetical protein
MCGESILGAPNISGVNSYLMGRLNPLSQVVFRDCPATNAEYSGARDHNDDISVVNSKKTEENTEGPENT